MKSKIKYILEISIILILVLSGNIYAANTTSNTNTSKSNTSSNSSSNSTSKNSSSSKSNNTSNTTNSSSTSNSSAKSSDATLSDLGIKPNDFKGFKTGTTNYSTTVPENVSEVEVYAKTTSSKASVTGTGKKKLNKGKNTVEVIVTAENGTKKTYTIVITREGSEEETSNSEATSTDTSEKEKTTANENIGDGLSSLKIEDLKIEPDFKTNVYEYRVKYIGEKDKLNIEAKTTNSNYTVEITGNNELKEGENIITILVSDANSNNIATYQVIVNKSLVDEETLAKEQEQKQKEEQKKKMIIAGGIGAGLLVFIIVIIAVIKHKQNKAWAEEYSVPYSGLNDDEDEFLQENEEIQNTVNNSQENNINEESLSKEKARETFLNNYNNSYDEIDDYEEKPRRKHKGKRFK